MPSHQLTNQPTVWSKIVHFSSPQQTSHRILWFSHVSLALDIELYVFSKLSKYIMPAINDGTSYKPATFYSKHNAIFFQVKHIKKAEHTIKRNEEENTHNSKTYSAF